jgi:hypothetical protein
MTVEEIAMRYAQATGYLQGVLNGMALHDNDIHPAQFKFIYEPLLRSAELSGNAMDDFDRERFNQKAKELGVIL